MDIESNTPSFGTGDTSSNELAAISAILDSETTTPVEAVVEETDNTGEFVSNETDDTATEQTEMDSETVETETEEGDESTADEADTNARDPNEIVFEIDGQTITREEASKGYMRQADYTRKTQETARLQSELNASIYGFNDRALQELHNVKQNIAVQMKMSEPDWAALQQEDPYSFAEKRVEWDKKEEIIRQLHAYEEQAREFNRAQEETKFKQDQELAYQYVDSLGYPEFANNESKKAMGSAMFKAAQDFGFSAKETSEIADGRLFDVLYWATKGKQAEAKTNQAKRVLADVPKVTSAKSSNKAPSKTTAGYNEAMRNFAANPSNSDAQLAAILKHL